MQSTILSIILMTENPVIFFSPVESSVYRDDAHSITVGFRLSGDPNPQYLLFQRGLSPSSANPNSAQEPVYVEHNSQKNSAYTRPCVVQYAPDTIIDFDNESASRLELSARIVIRGTSSSVVEAPRIIFQ